VAGARQAVEAGADIIVAQGTEAGGHGGARATLPLVAAVVDAVPDRPVLAAGGIADGRGLAAALMLGAQGVVCGTAFCAAEESLVHTAARRLLPEAEGDATLRSTVFDIARAKNWPEEYTLRTLENAFSTRWHGRTEALRADGETARKAYHDALENGDFQEAAVIVGEAIDLVHAIEPAADILTRMVEEATTRLSGASRYLDD